MAARGLLIAVEAGDRCGKTTQCQLLQTWLQDEQRVRARYVKFPERTTPVGKMIDGYLRGSAALGDEAVHLLFSANRWELKAEIEGELARGTTVVLDRYTHSGVAYSSAKGLDLAWCWAPEIGLPKPDAVLFLALPVETSAARNGFGEERYENVALQQKVAARFQLLQDDTWISIDGVGAIEEVHERIRAALSPLLVRPLPPLALFDWHAVEPSPALR